MIVANDRISSHNSFFVIKTSELFPYFAPFMDVTVSRERHIPCVSGGYSNTNPNEYANNRVNIVGSYRPFLLKTLESLDISVKQRIARLIAGTIKLMHENGDRTDIPNSYGNGEADKERCKLNLEFWISLGMEVDDPLFQFFDAEGFSFISEYFVCFHKDTQNDSKKDGDETISLKSRVLITEELSRISKVGKLMRRYCLKVGDYLPISLMIYSRKCVSAFCVRHSKVQSVFSGSPFVKHASRKLTCAILDALHDTESVQNYSKLWDNDDSFLEMLHSMKSDVNSHQCSTKFASKLPSFSKDVSN